MSEIEHRMIGHRPRAEPVSSVLYRKGRLVSSELGGTFWFPADGGGVFGDGVVRPDRTER